jgi:hypothetical protein
MYAHSRQVTHYLTIYSGRVHLRLLHGALTLVVTVLGRVAAVKVVAKVVAAASVSVPRAADVAVLLADPVVTVTLRARTIVVSATTTAANVIAPGAPMPIAR